MSLYGPSCMDPNNLKNPNLWGEQMQERVPNLRTNVDIICGLFVDIFIYIYNYLKIIFHSALQWPPNPPALHLPPLCHLCFVFDNFKYNSYVFLPLLWIIFCLISQVRSSSTGSQCQVHTASDTCVVTGLSAKGLSSRWWIRSDAVIFINVNTTTSILSPNF